MKDRKSIRRKKMGQRKARGQTPPPAVSLEDGPVRLNRFLARAGVASRREADRLIEAGRVLVDGNVVTELGTKVTSDQDVVVDGKPVRPSSLVYVLLNKPRNTITTVSDEKDRRTVLDLVSLPESEKSALFPVGRLDRDTTGALLLTTDGDLGHRLMHPRYGATKLYRVETAEPISDEQFDRLREGVELEDGPARPDALTRIEDDPRQIALQLHEGRNRQVRRMVAALGHEVRGLERTHYAGLTLDGLRRGRWRKLKPHEINGLRRLVKLKPIVF